ncbi:MAG: heme-binding protein [Synergistes sp.]|nr:heme-binding protein [Synergistes sp.]
MDEIKNMPFPKTHDIETLRRQDAELVFKTFNQDDAVALACKILASAEDKGITACVIVELAGFQVARIFPEGTSEFNELWMNKKLKTAKMMGKSTLLLWAEMDAMGMKRKASFSPDGELALCGGGFPIKVEGCGVIGAVAVSGPGDTIEHDLIAEAMKESILQK